MNIIQSFLTKNPCYQANVNKVDSRYITFQSKGPQGLMLHSVGCSQPSAKVFVSIFNNSSYDSSCVHAFIDSDSGDVYQTLPWNYRGWHGASGVKGSCNDTMVGIEICESKYIKYLNPGDQGYCPGKFIVLDKVKALNDCRRTYLSAVELFGILSIKYNLSVDNCICSHKEGYTKGIASNHGDPEHYWSGVGSGYTMKGFREDVKAYIKGVESQMYYRIRKSWDDTKSQIGAYKDFELAKKSCPLGYSVFDNNGKVLYTSTEKTINSDPSGKLMISQDQFNNLMDNWLRSRRSLSPDNWSCDSRLWAESNGIIKGSSNGSMNYKSFATREEVIELLYRHDSLLSDK